MTSSDRESSDCKKIIKRIGYVLMLISILVFLIPFLLPPLKCFVGCPQFGQQEVGLLLLALLLFISGVFLSWIGSRRRKPPTNID